MPDVPPRTNGSIVCQSVFGFAAAFDFTAIVGTDVDMVRGREKEGENRGVTKVAEAIAAACARAISQR